MGLEHEVSELGIPGLTEEWRRARRAAEAGAGARAWAFLRQLSRSRTTSTAVHAAPEGARQKFKPKTSGPQRGPATAGQDEEVRLRAARKVLDVALEWGTLGRLSAELATLPLA